MKIKALSNGFTCSGFWLQRRMGDEYDPDSEKILDHVVGWNRVMIDPILNREGWYCTKDKCWREFKLPSGRLVAVLANDSRDHFNFQMNMLNAEENPIPDDVWESIQFLVKKKYLPMKGKYIFEQYRRANKQRKIDSGKRLMSFKKRVRNARK